MREEIFWLVLWTIIGIVILGIVGFSTTHYTKVHLAFIEGGYEQTTALGHTGRVWQKADIETPDRPESPID